MIESADFTEVIFNRTRIAYTSSSVAGIPLRVAALPEVLAMQATIGVVLPRPIIIVEQLYTLAINLVSVAVAFAHRLAPIAGLMLSPFVVWRTRLDKDRMWYNSIMAW